MTDVTFLNSDARTVDETELAFHMDEDAFRHFYEGTARAVWVYLARATRDERLADDLMQEAYYRFLRARVQFESDDHRRFYLFRIATNLVRDHQRRPQPAALLDESSFAPVESSTADRVTRRLDLSRAMDKLTARERSLLWLAYAQGFSHAEIAASLGLRTGSLKSLLFRARKRLLAALNGMSGDV